MNYRLIGRHTEDTAEGPMLAPGDSTEILPNFDPSHPHNRRMIDDGVLIPIPGSSPLTAVPDLPADPPADDSADSTKTKEPK